MQKNNKHTNLYLNKYNIDMDAQYKHHYYGYY